MKIIDRIQKEANYIIEKFQNWEVNEQILGDKSAFYMLKDPNSEYQKVCLYSDGHHMFLYGDYGTYVFDDMTFIGNPFNLPYENTPYLIEKMNSDYRKHLYIFNEYQCEKDIFQWTKSMLEDEIEDDSVIQEILSILEKENDLFEIQKQCFDKDYEFNDKEQIKDILYLAFEGLSYCDSEHYFKNFLENNSSNICKIDDYNSDLFTAGNETDIRFIISLYAMQVCRDKLKDKVQIKDINNIEYKEIE